MIKFVCCFWNAESYIKNCIRTLKSQKDTEFEVYLIDDISTDNSVEVVNKLIEGDNRFKLIVNTEKKFKLRNLDELISTFDDEDIVIEIDGASHKGRVAHDAIRDQAFGAHDIAVYRFSNDEVEKVASHGLFRYSIKRCRRCRRCRLAPKLFIFYFYYSILWGVASHASHSFYFIFFYFFLRSKIYNK